MDFLAYNDLVKTHIIHNMTNQVMRELENETDVCEGINFAVGSANNKESDINVRQWWLVSNVFAYAAKECGEIIVDTPFGAIWGSQYDITLFAMDISVEEIMHVIDDFRRSKLLVKKSE
jgi:hypothetical protein